MPMAVVKSIARRHYRAVRSVSRLINTAASSSNIIGVIARHLSIPEVNRRRSCLSIINNIMYGD